MSTVPPKGPTYSQTGRFEVWFLSDERVSVLVETSLEEGSPIERELLEITVFAGLAAGIIGSLGKVLARPLCERLARFPLPESRDDTRRL